MGGFLSLLLNLLRGLLGVGQPARASAEANATGRATAAETNLGTEKQANAEVLAAIQAGNAADALAVRKPSSLRDPDPNSRD